MRSVIMKSQRKNNRKRKLLKKKVILCLAFFVLLSILILPLSTHVMAGSEREEQVYTYYASIQIQPGDTLWSIANTYAPSTSLSVNEYIKEIKKMNCLNSDQITAEMYLSVFYCSSEYK
ncbi:MAG: LysM peptidoglycan-binding domain-containing protein [Lachnospiraceae bacterium]